MQFKYLPRPYIQPDGEKGVIFVPEIPIRLKYKNNFCQYPITCLVDSGADRNLFSPDYADLLSIKIKQGKLVKHTGIDGKSIEAFVHPVKIIIGGYDFNTEIDFSSETKANLLGRTCFFKFFNKIEFDENDKIISLYPLINKK